MHFIVRHRSFPPSPGVWTNDRCAPGDSTPSWPSRAVILGLKFMCEPENQEKKHAESGAWTQCSVSGSQHRCLFCYGNSGVFTYLLYFQSNVILKFGFFQLKNTLKVIDSGIVIISRSVDKEHMANKVIRFFIWMGAKAISIYFRGHSRYWKLSNNFRLDTDVSLS